MAKQKLIRVNRSAFMGWLQGDLLHFENGKGYCNDSIDHDRAEEALSRGESIELTDAEGRTISTLVPDPERKRLVEHLAKDTEGRTISDLVPDLKRRRLVKRPAKGN